MSPGASQGDPLFATTLFQSCLFFFLSQICLFYVGVWAPVYHDMHAGSENTLREPVLFFYHVGCWNTTLVVWLGSKLSYPLSHLAPPLPHQLF